jgi:hypothetical protein
MKFIALVFFLIACTSHQNNSIFKPLSSGEQLDSKSDTVKPIISTGYINKTYPIIFEAAYFRGTKVKQGQTDFDFQLMDIGKINIESGYIIACDPIVMKDAIPYTQKTPIGHFPVQLSMAKTINDERVAFCRILFSNKSVARWEIALQPGQKRIDLNDTTIYCYGVDAGTGIFIDERSNDVFKHKNQSDWENVFVKKAEENGYKGFIYDFEGHNLATFPTGYGDGCYATYIGFDDQNNICRLLTDFGLVQWWKLPEK